MVIDKITNLFAVLIKRVGEDCGTEGGRVYWDIYSVDVSNSNHVHGINSDLLRLNLLDKSLVKARVSQTVKEVSFMPLAVLNGKGITN